METIIIQIRYNPGTPGFEWALGSGTVGFKALHDGDDFEVPVHDKAIYHFIRPATSSYEISYHFQYGSTALAASLTADGIPLVLPAYAIVGVTLAHAGSSLTRPARYAGSFKVTKNDGLPDLVDPSYHALLRRPLASPQLANGDVSTDSEPEACPASNDHVRNKP